MLIYKNRKQKILLSGLHLQNDFNRRFSTEFKIMCQKLKQKIKIRLSCVHIQTIKILKIFFPIFIFY